MKKLSLIPLLLLAACANNPQGGAVLGGAVGAGAGAAVGHSVGGRDGAIIGGAIGAAAGAAIGHDQSTVQQPQRPVPQRSRNEAEYRHDQSDRDDHGERRKKHEHDDHERD